MSRRLLHLAVLLTVLPLAPARTEPQSGAPPTDEELAPLAASLGAYLEARTSTVALDEAQAALTTSLAALAEAVDGDPLRQHAVLERALWLSRGLGEHKLRTGKVVTGELTGGSFDGAGLELAWRLPRSYDAGERWPLILALPDADESPAAHLREHWTLPGLTDGAILVSPEMPADPENWARVMVDGRPGGLCNVLTALRLAIERFAVDPDRVYVAGRGTSVPAAVAAGNYAPQRFAGVLGRAGDVGEQGHENFRNLPTLFTGAGLNARDFQEAARAAELDNCTLDPDGTEEDVWHWILEHPRETWPDRVTVVTGTPFPTRAYWLRVAPSAPDARATAILDRSSGEIRITGQGVSHAILYLSDALVDLDQPLRVVCNEVEHTVTVARNPAVTLNMLHDGTSDAGCVYVAEAVFDMSGEEPATAADDLAEPDPELDERLAAAGADAGALWELYRWCWSTDRERRSVRVLRRLLRADPDHAEARAAFGHERADGHWFTSPEALERYRQSQDPALAQAAGRVEHRSVWMHPDERKLVGKGWERDPETGLWTTPSDRRRLDEGWVRQDLEWIPPDGAEQQDAGLWWTDGEWLDLAAADRRHARIDSMWRIPSADVLLFSTAGRETCLRALAQMRRAMPDLQRVFGAEPLLPLRVCLLRDEEQYDRFAFGDPDGRRRATHAGRLHVVHTAFFAESWLPLADGSPEFSGMGVGFWDALVPYGDLYGVHSARLALGLSYVDALDPSPKAARRALRAGPENGYFESYEAEKALPAWLRWGGAVYAERYFRDPTVTSDGDPWWARAWSLENLQSRGGLRPLSEVFEFALDPDERDDGLKLLIEAGLVVAFMLDGACEPVIAEHAALKRALSNGRLHANHVEALTEALLAHEDELRAFADE